MAAEFRRIRYRDRRACAIENARIRVTVLEEGGHIAELLDKASGVNPLWTPPWPSIEPSTYDQAQHAALYGDHGESKLLAGIMGHNLCMDIFGGPSPEEAAAGLTVHGEGSMVPYEITEEGGALKARATFPLAHLRFERTIRLQGPLAWIEERVFNESACDRPTGWTQHVTLGPPFIARGKTQFRASATQSRVIEIDFAGPYGRYQPGADFEWPHVPLKTGGTLDLRVMPDAEASGGYTAHLMNPTLNQAYFIAWNPDLGVLCGYVWRPNDFPWLGIWEENCSRKGPPWNGVTLTRGMEFGVSPMPETRRQMVDRGKLFGVPCYRWIPARTELRATYCAFVAQARAIPETLDWDWSGQVLPSWL